MPRFMLVCITHEHTHIHRYALTHTNMRMHTPVVERPMVSLVLCHPYMSPGRAVFIIMPTFLMRKLGSDVVQIYNVQWHPNCAWGKPGLGGPTCSSSGPVLCSGGSNYSVGGCRLPCFLADLAHMGVVHPCSEQGP